MADPKSSSSAYVNPLVPLEFCSSQVVHDPQFTHLLTTYLRLQSVISEYPIGIEKLSEMVSASQIFALGASESLSLEKSVGLLDYGSENSASTHEKAFDTSELISDLCNNFEIMTIEAEQLIQVRGSNALSTTELQVEMKRLEQQIGDLLANFRSSVRATLVGEKSSLEEQDESSLKSTHKSKKLPHTASQVLTEWFEHHQDCPYPTLDEKKSLSETTGLDIMQIHNWFTNMRRRKRTSKGKGEPKKPQAVKRGRIRYKALEEMKTENKANSCQKKSSTSNEIPSTQGSESGIDAALYQDIAQSSKRRRSEVANVYDEYKPIVSGGVKPTMYSSQAMGYIMHQNQMGVNPYPITQFHEESSSITEHSSFGILNSPHLSQYAPPMPRTDSRWASQTVSGWVPGYQPPTQGQMPSRWRPEYGPIYTNAVYSRPVWHPMHPNPRFNYRNQ